MKRATTANSERGDTVAAAAAAAAASSAHAQPTRPPQAHRHRPNSAQQAAAQHQPTAGHPQAFMHSAHSIVRKAAAALIADSGVRVITPIVSQTPVQLNQHHQQQQRHLHQHHHQRTASQQHQSQQQQQPQRHHQQHPRQPQQQQHPQQQRQPSQNQSHHQQRTPQHNQHQQQHHPNQRHRQPQHQQSHSRRPQQHHGGSKSDTKFRSYPRTWVAADRPVSAAAAASSSSSRPPPLSFSLICYNVLCGAYVEPSFYPLAPRWLLNDSYRRRTIAQQLTGASRDVDGSVHPLANASIVALQEVDEYTPFWKPTMAAAGYASSWKARTSTQAVRADGLAVFWKTDLFDLVDSLGIDYSIWPTEDRKDNVGMAVLLRCNEATGNTSAPPRYLAVVNTHLLFNHRRGELKIGQMQIMINSIDAWLNRFTRAQIAAGAQAPAISLLFCGDYNSSPASTLLQYATHGELNLDSDVAYASLNTLGWSQRSMRRQLMDGVEAHQHQRALNEDEQLQLAFSKQQQQLKQSATLSSASHRACGKRRRGNDDNESQSESEMSDIEMAPDVELTMQEISEQYEKARAEAEDAKDSKMAAASTATQKHHGASSSSPAASGRSSTRVPFPSTNTTSWSDTLNAFFPFNELDTATHIRHQLNLVPVYTDADEWRVRERIRLLKQGNGMQSAAVFAGGAPVPQLDPRTGLPLRYRPTGHDHRGSQPVDHVLFSPDAYRFEPTMWRTDGLGDWPQQVMQSRLQQQAGERASANQRIDLTEDSDSDESSSPPIAPAQKLRVTALLELPPASAFQVKEETQFVRVKQAQVQVRTQLEVAATVSSSADASASATVINASQQQQQAFTYVTEQIKVKVRDPRLPTPAAPSDHFPIGIRFEIV